MSSAEFNSTIKRKLTSKVNPLLNISDRDRTHFIVKLIEPGTGLLRCMGTITEPSTLVTALSCVDDPDRYPIIYRKKFMNVGLHVHNITNVDECQNYATVHVSRIRKESR